MNSFVSHRQSSLYHIHRIPHLGFGRFGGLGKANMYLSQMRMNTALVTLP